MHKSHVSIPDSFFAVPNAVYNILPVPNKNGTISHNKQQFKPCGILINSNVDGQSTTAIVRGWLDGESAVDADNYTFETNVIHEIEFKAIEEEDTTARGIKILSL